MYNKDSGLLDIGFVISTSNNFLILGLTNLLQSIMSKHFRGVSYSNNDNRVCNSKYKLTLHILDIESTTIANKTSSPSENMAFCFIMPGSKRYYKNNGSTIIYVSQSLRIVEQELTKAIKLLINPKTIQNQICNKKNTLTNRQKEILRFLLNGYSVNYISKRIFISLKTVYSHRQAIYIKLGVRNSAELFKNKHLIEVLYNNECKHGVN